MKPGAMKYIAIGAAITAGAFLLYTHHAERPVKHSAPETMIPAEKPLPDVETTSTRSINPHSISPAPKPRPLKQKAAAPKTERHTSTEKQKPIKPNHPKRPVNTAQFWEKAEERFSQQWDRLEQENNPTLRARLINNMAQYVRMDTLATVAWAMDLENPEERRMAMEAVNKYALTGIGARIEVDETGFPSIRETTALSAVESTGMVEPGDYIIGVRDESGNYVDFEGLTTHQIVQHLRGKAGTDILLYMERLSGLDDSAGTFEVPVRRSLLVIQPPN